MQRMTVKTINPQRWRLFIFTIHYGQARQLTREYSINLATRHVKEAEHPGVNFIFQFSPLFFLVLGRVLIENLEYSNNFSSHNIENAERI